VGAGGLNPSRLKAGSPSEWTTARDLADAREAWDHNPAFAFGWVGQKKENYVDGGGLSHRQS
jgi:hypothetical protein